MKLKEKLEHKADRYEISFMTQGSVKRRVLSYFRHMKQNRQRYVSLLREPKDIKKSCIKEGREIYEDLDHVGIVFQGPICKKDHFTVQSVLLYRWLYPNVKIVLSSWYGEISDEERTELEKNGCMIVENPPMPLQQKGRGAKPSSLNNQLCSSLAGIKVLACDKKIQYILKIRTDVRIYKPDFLKYFLNMLETVSLVDKNKEHSRLAAVSFSNMRMSVPFHMSDFIWFGKKEDMLLFYSAKWRSEKELSEIVKKYNSKKFLQSYKQKFALLMQHGYFNGGCYEWYDTVSIDENFMLAAHEECVLAYSYYKNIRSRLDEKPGMNLLERYHGFIKKEMVIIDEEELDIYWNKDAAWNFRSDSLEYEHGKLTHSKWLNLLADELRK